MSEENVSGSTVADPVQGASESSAVPPTEPTKAQPTSPVSGPVKTSVVPSEAVPAPTPATPTLPAKVAAPAKPAVNVVPTGPKPVSITTAVNAAQGAKRPVPKGLTLFNTRSLAAGYFHGCIYGETSARKTTTAAHFGTPEDARIILTRREEQLIPLRNEGYEVACVKDADSLLFALKYPEQLWPDWATNPNRTLVLDDATEGVAMLLEDASEIDGKEVRDKRRSYSKAGDDLREAVKTVLSKPMHFVMVALAKVRENGITQEERIAPDLPPSMQNLVLTELEFVFYIKKNMWKLATDTEYISVTRTNEATGKEETYKREIFAKNKLPFDLRGKGIVNKVEEMDLAKIWRKVKEGKAA